MRGKCYQIFQLIRRQGEFSSSFAACEKFTHDYQDTRMCKSAIARLLVEKVRMGYFSYLKEPTASGFLNL